MQEGSSLAVKEGRNWNLLGVVTGKCPDEGPTRVARLSTYIDWITKESGKQARRIYCDGEYLMSSDVFHSLKQYQCVLKQNCKKLNMI